MDVLTPEQRSRNMSRVRGRDTQPELLLRRALHRAGLRFRLHGKELPGRPDLVFAGPRAVVFVHGCFWHGHGCPLFRLPSTRREFWADKIGATRARDGRAMLALREAGWRTLVVWECALRGRAKRPLDAVVGEVRSFVRGGEYFGEIQGNWSCRGDC
jgi:DNA mismatch endonuclease, patch repair protein